MRPIEYRVVRVSVPDAAPKPGGSGELFWFEKKNTDVVQLQPRLTLPPSPPSVHLSPRV